MENSKIEVGDQVPHFTLKDQNGENFAIRDYIGKKKMIIFFYPKDESAVCTKEACAFRDSYQYFEEAGAIVIGINSGSAESHKAFAQHHNLNFTLLSDPENKVLKLFGIKNFLFLTGRETFVIDESGKVKFRYRGLLNGNAHVEETIEYLQSQKVRV
ncbi:peroxiredoxin Q/BCP [Pedobacter westerhofensis]|uniref:thioredoxin-dependent peroxiredoxin n=1 Tax=Pedobacter westerhofensis TaxID=425512 RepID=A0A521FT08_9SPHI|nr:peroxiredoxin [Pedobacter westerhofensis]SMO98670.1 peroxiredoxin Q/BCP [Pedobacter westerhofensis]